MSKLKNKMLSSAGGAVKSAYKRLRKVREKKSPSDKLSSMDRSAESYKRKEFLSSTPRNSINNRPIPQLEDPSKLKGNLMKGLKKFSDKNIPAPIAQQVDMNSAKRAKDAFSRKPVQ